MQLQRQVEDVLGNKSWETVRRAGNVPTLTYRRVAGEADVDRYRAVAVPTRGQPSVSKTTTIKVWHWYPLVSFNSYYETHGVSAHLYNQFAMNGTSYVGSWYTYGGYRSWESRFTLGRKCTHLRGVFGVTDDSADGLAGTVEVLAEGQASAFVSPTLRPGAVMDKRFPIRRAYRISMAARDTTDTATLGDITSFPAIGNAQVLCHAVD